jgi:hypothetical protein
MQSFGLDLVVVAGHHPRVTAFAGQRFLDVIDERLFPEWSRRPASKVPPAAWGREEKFE